MAGASTCSAAAAPGAPPSGGAASRRRRRRQRGWGMKPAVLRRTLTTDCASLPRLCVMPDGRTNISHAYRDVRPARTGRSPKSATASGAWADGRVGRRRVRRRSTARRARVHVLRYRAGLRRRQERAAARRSAEAPPDKTLVATKIPPKNLKWPALPTIPLDEVFPADHIREYTEMSLEEPRRRHASTCSSSTSGPTRGPTTNAGSARWTI